MNIARIFDWKINSVSIMQTVLSWYAFYLVTKKWKIALRHGFTQNPLYFGMSLLSRSQFVCQNSLHKRWPNLMITRLSSTDVRSQTLHCLICRAHGTSLLYLSTPLEELTISSFRHNYCSLLKQKIYVFGFFKNYNPCFLIKTVLQETCITA